MRTLTPHLLTPQMFTPRAGLVHPGTRRMLTPRVHTSCSHLRWRRAASWRVPSASRARRCTAPKARRAATRLSRQCPSLSASHLCIVECRYVRHGAAVVRASRARRRQRGGRAAADANPAASTARQRRLGSAARRHLLSSSRRALFTPLFTPSGELRLTLRSLGGGVSAEEEPLRLRIPRPNPTV